MKKLITNFGLLMTFLVVFSYTALNAEEPLDKAKAKARNTHASLGVNKAQKPENPLDKRAILAISNVMNQNKSYKEFEAVIKDITERNKVESKADLLQSTENILSIVNALLALLAVFIAAASFFLAWLYKQAQRKLDSYDREIKAARKVLKKTKMHLSNLDETDILTKTKISAIQQTLILCLENAPSRDIAFSTYSKLLAAYEVLLDNSYKDNISPEIQEEMEIKATLIQGNKQYVPDSIVHFMIENMNLPYEVRGILWGKS